MSETKHSKVEFSGWWNELNREFPPFKIPADVLSAMADRWYRELSEFSIHALNDSLSTWLRTQDRRPKLAHMRGGCLAYLMRVNAAKDITRKRSLPDVSSNNCPCGCGGARWAAVLLDRAGEPRTERIEGTDGTFYDATRDHLECITADRDRIPTFAGRFLGRDARGIPVWIVGERSLEVAA